MVSAAAGMGLEGRPAGQGRLPVRVTAAPLQATTRDVHVTGKLAGIRANDLTCESGELTTSERTYFATDIRNANKTCEMTFRAVDLVGTLQLEVAGSAGDLILTGRSPVSGKRSVSQLAWWPRTLFHRSRIDLGAVKVEQDVSPGTSSVTVEAAVHSVIPGDEATCDAARLVVNGERSTARVGTIVPNDAVFLVCTITFRDVPIDSSIEILLAAARGGNALHDDVRKSASTKWWQKADHSVVKLSLGLKDGAIDLPGGGGPGRDGPPSPCPGHDRGDANCDGVVNTLDCAKALAETDAGVVDKADFNGDGRVDRADYDICLAHVGEGVGQGFAPAPPQGLGNGSASAPEGGASADPADEPPCALFEDGDVNCDGTVDQGDIEDALRALLGLTRSIDADVNRDGKVNRADMDAVKGKVERWIEKQRP